MATRRPVRISYDAEAEAAYLSLGARRVVARTEWRNEGTVGIDEDDQGQVVGVELLGVAQPVVRELGVGGQENA